MSSWLDVNGEDVPALVVVLLFGIAVLVILVLAGGVR